MKIICIFLSLVLLTFLMPIRLVSANQNSKHEQIKDLTEKMVEGTLTYDEYITLSVYYININHLDMAEKNLKKAIVINKTSSLPYKLLAKIYENKRENRLALEYWKKYLERINENTEESFIEEAQKHIKRIQGELDNENTY